MNPRNKPNTNPVSSRSALDLVGEMAGIPPRSMARLIDAGGIDSTAAPDPLARLVGAQVLDRVSARAVALIAENRFDHRDLKQLLPARRSVSFRPAVLPVGSTLGRYTIQGLLGTGGDARVYLSRHPMFGRPVAVKVFHPNRADKFKAEAAVGTRISHPNVVRLWDADEADGEQFVVYEYAPGGDLRRIIASGRVFLPEAARRVAIHAVRGLRAGIKAGLTHGDVKPANILIGAGRVYQLADANPAGFAAPLRTRGSWRYSAPECFDGAGDLRSDIYSLGLTLTELLIGKPLVTARTYHDCRDAHHALSPEPLHWSVPGLGRATSAVIGRMTAREPAERFSDYDELLEAVAKALPRRSADGSTNPPEGS